MGLLILICAVALLVHIGRSPRWPRLDPWRKRWRPWDRRIGGYMRSAPFTYVFLFVLLITTWVYNTSRPSIARTLLLERSTNLHQLGHDPMRVLVASAFWLSSSWELFVWLVLFSLVLAPVERWIGSDRTAFVFALGHAGATLLTAPAFGWRSATRSSECMSRTPWTWASATASSLLRQCWRSIYPAVGEPCTSPF